MQHRQHKQAKKNATHTHRTVSKKDAHLTPYINTPFDVFLIVLSIYE